MALQRTELHALNKASARIAQFLVRVCDPQAIDYEFKSKRDGSMVKQRKFECLLVGEKPASYCIGALKGSQKEVQAALSKFTASSTWTLSKVIFDGHADPAYVNAPIKLRVDLSKSQLEPHDPKVQAELCRLVAQYPVPPRTVAETVQITTTRATDLIAVAKTISITRETKGGAVADVVLIDESKMGNDAMATVTVSVWGDEKIKFIRAHKAEPMVFLNLLVKCLKGMLQINHWPKEKVAVAPVCPKADMLKSKVSELQGETNTITITSDYVPQARRDVSGPQVLSCCAFLDFTSESPKAEMPDVVQINWVHLEEPQIGTGVLDKTGSRLWFLVDARDVSGATRLGVPERVALSLTGCKDKEDFVEMHSKGVFKFPLFCNLRISRRTRPATNDGATQPASEGSSATQSAEEATTYVSHTIEDLEPVTWNPSSAPNAAYTKILEILNHCPRHDEGIVYAFLSDLDYSPYYGFDVRFNGDALTATKGKAVAALIASSTKSLAEETGYGYKVTTTNVSDAANPNSGTSDSIRNYTVLGYCSLADMLEYKLDPPRGQRCRFAAVLITQVESSGDADGQQATVSLMVEKLECIESGDAEHAMASFRKLRRLSMRLHPVSEEKRSHALDHLFLEAPRELKRCRTLRAVPTDVSLPEAEEW